jgi:outer membrane receptor protein involved in Fe transport
VTVTDANGIHLGAGSGDRRSYGARASNGDDGAWRFDGSASAVRSDRYDFPDRQPADEDRRYAAVELGHGGFALKAVAADRDDHAIIPLPPPSGPPRPGAPTTRAADERERNHIVELRYAADPAPAWHVETWASHLETEAEQINLEFEGSRTELGAQAQFDGAGQHLLAQATLARPRIDHAVQRQPPNQPPGPVLPIDISGDEHDTFSLTVQDQVDVGANLSFTGGLRYDRMEDVDARVSPRLAALWRISERSSLKAQYAEGFRTPTFVESYSSGAFDTTLDYETIASSELEYIYRDARTVFRATLYRERAQDLLQPRLAPGAHGHENRSDLVATGVELELTRQLAPWLKAIATWSHGQTEDGRGNAPGRRVDSFGRADSLANLALIARRVPGAPRTATTSSTPRSRTASATSMACRCASACTTRSTPTSRTCSRSRTTRGCSTTAAGCGPRRSTGRSEANPLSLHKRCEIGA